MTPEIIANASSECYPWAVRVNGRVYLRRSYDEALQFVLACTEAERAILARIEALEAERGLARSYHAH